VTERSEVTVNTVTVDVAGGLASYLGEAWGEDVKVSDLSTTTAGARRHNVIFAATVGGETRRLVATIVPEGETLINSIDAEAGVRAVAEEAGVAVPHVHLVRTDGELVGGPFMVSDYVDGETVPRRVLRLVAERGIGELVARQLGETLARLHAVDPATAPVTLRRMEHDGPPAEAALAAMTAAVDELPQRRPVLELGLRWLGRHLPSPPARESIVHSDVRNGNLIVGPDGLRAVLDWEGALASGDPMQDLAWPALRMWRFREEDREISGFAGRAPFVAGYEAAGGRFDEGRFRWWKVEGTLRWAAGLAGQAMAYLDGRVPSIVMAASGRRVSELEWDLLMLIRP
jgi:aminoglycoside phosphotransferase (APT) family kinase protein